jgi:hypothetical protein
LCQNNDTSNLNIIKVRRRAFKPQFGVKVLQSGKVATGTLTASPLHQSLASARDPIKASCHQQGRT